MSKVTIAEFSHQGEFLALIEKEKVVKDWAKELPPATFCVTRESATDRAFSVAGYDSHIKGLYRCVCCDNALFTSNTKYNSFTGWPSFYEPISSENVDYHKDYELGQQRIEVTCKLCDAHLGHIFDDGPEPTGLRYCMNMSALKLVPFDDINTPAGKIDILQQDLTNTPSVIGGKVENKLMKWFSDIVHFLA